MITCRKYETSKPVTYTSTVGQHMIASSRHVHPRHPHEKEHAYSLSSSDLGHREERTVCALIWQIGR